MRHIVPQITSKNLFPLPLREGVGGGLSSNEFLLMARTDRIQLICLTSEAISHNAAKIKLFIDNYFNPIILIALLTW